MIWRPNNLTRAQREERRLEAGRLLQTGQLSLADIARQLGVSRMTVSRWAKRLAQHQGDIGSLKNRGIPGRPPRLTAAQWHQVLALLQQGALKAGFDTDRWTLRRIRALILLEFGVDYHAHYLARRLKALGWSPQRPAIYARERDDELVRAWLRHDWSRIKKRLVAQGPRSSLSMRRDFHFRPRPPPRGHRLGERQSCGVSASAGSSLRSLP
jgi:transposase